MNWNNRVEHLVREKATEVGAALGPVRDHALASAREAVLTVSSLFEAIAAGLDHLRSKKNGAVMDPPPGVGGI